MFKGDRKVVLMPDIEESLVKALKNAAKVQHVAGKTHRNALRMTPCLLSQDDLFRRIFATLLQVTFNDVMFAAFGGAIRRYCARRDDPLLAKGKRAPRIEHFSDTIVTQLKST